VLAWRLVPFGGTRCACLSGWRYILPKCQFCDLVLKVIAPGENESVVTASSPIRAGVNLLSNSASSLSFMKENSVSSSAWKTSAGAMVFLPAFVVCSFALAIGSAWVGQMVQRSRATIHVLRGNVVDEQGGALAQGKDGVCLNLSVWRKHALGQPRYYRFW
jgi:hypothetical protein